MPRTSGNSFGALLVEDDDDMVVPSTPKQTPTPTSVPTPTTNGWSKPPATTWAKPSTTPKRADNDDDWRGQRKAPVVTTPPPSAVKSAPRTSGTTGTTRVLDNGLTVQKTNPYNNKEKVVSVIRTIWTNPKISPEQRIPTLVSTIFNADIPAIFSYLRTSKIENEVTKGATIHAQILKIIEFCASLSLHELFTTRDPKYTISLDEIQVRGFLKETYQNEPFVSDNRINIFMALLIVDQSPDLYTAIHWIPFSIVRDPKHSTHVVQEFTRTTEDMIRMYTVCYYAGYTPITINKIGEQAIGALEYAKNTGRLHGFDEKKIFDYLLHPSTFVIERMLKERFNKLTDKTASDPIYRDCLKWLAMNNPELFIRTFVFQVLNIGHITDKTVEVGKKFSSIGYSHLTCGMIGNLTMILNSQFDTSKNNSLGRIIIERGYDKRMPDVRQQISKIFPAVFNEVYASTLATVDAKYSADPNEHETVICNKQFAAGFVFGLLSNDASLCETRIKDNIATTPRLAVACMTACHLTKRISFVGRTDFFPSMIDALGKIDSNAQFMIYDVLERLFNMPADDDAVEFMESCLKLTKPGEVDSWEDL